MIDIIPNPICYTLNFTPSPSGFDDVLGLDFGNGKPAIDVTKKCTAVVPLGTPINYEFVVKNTGNVNLVNVDVDDPTVGFNNSPDISLAVGISQTYTASLNPPLPTVINNTVYAKGFYGPATVNKQVSDSALCSTKVVDARISIVQSDKNSITEPHTFTVTVEKNPGTGWVPAAGVVVTPTETGVGSITAETCTAKTNALGQCTVTVNSTVEGTSTVNASAAVDVEGVLINVATDGYGKFTVSNVKEWVDGSLKWFKYDDKGQLLGGATFEVCRTHDRAGVDIPDVCVTVLDNTAPDADPDNGEFLLTGLVLGRYTIEETVPPLGFLGDDFVETLELTLDTPDQVATHAWVNVPFEGCTPGFWQGGNDFGTAGGKWLWNVVNDPEWVASGGDGFNPYIWSTNFCGFFGCGLLTSQDMWYYINPSMWTVNDDFSKAARSMTAAYLNVYWGMNYYYTKPELDQMWATALLEGEFLSLHNKLDAANNALYRTQGGDHCPISASGW